MDWKTNALLLFQLNSAALDSQLLFQVPFKSLHRCFHMRALFVVVIFRLREVWRVWTKCLVRGRTGSFELCPATGDWATHCGVACHWVSVIAYVSDSNQSDRGATLARVRGEILGLAGGGFFRGPVQ